MNATDVPLDEVDRDTLAAVTGGLELQIDLTQYRMLAEIALKKLDLAGRAELALAKDAIVGPIPRSFP